VSDDLTFASAGVAGVHYARCWACMYGDHFPVPTWHSWAGREDVEHARVTGQADPSDRRCACPCVDDAEFCEANASPEGPDVGFVSLDAVPCGVCGEGGACGYDDEGRPLIHAQWEDDDS
jgi:hypothetical protein